MPWQNCCECCLISSLLCCRYFQCVPLFGLFAPVSKVMLISPSTSSLRRGSGSVSRIPIGPSLALSRERSGSQESLSSVGSMASTASRPRLRLGVMSLAGQVVIGYKWRWTYTLHTFLVRMTGPICMVDDFGVLCLSMTKYKYPIHCISHFEYIGPTVLSHFEYKYPFQVHLSWVILHTSIHFRSNCHESFLLQVSILGPTVMSHFQYKHPFLVHLSCNVNVNVNVWMQLHL